MTKPVRGSAMIVEPEAETRAALCAWLEASRLRVDEASTPDVARRLLAERATDLVFCHLDTAEGAGFIAELAELHPDAHLVAWTSHDDTQLAVAAMRAGAVDVLVKPSDVAAVRHVVDKALQSIERTEAPVHAGSTAEGDLVGEAPPMKKLRQLIDKAATGDVTVLLRGESGTGKELAARRLHDQSARRDGPFVTVHCAALPDTLLESELFGYVKGAFSGATSERPGRVELAEGGTLFLDEIGDVPPLMQVKLLRLLQDRAYERLGEGKPRRADVRFVAATHRDLETLVKEGSFREDLFYRLNVVPVWLPPLRTRRGDVSRLAPHFCTEFAGAYGRPGLTFTPEALALLARQSWPGNVRQLRNLVERMVVLSESDQLDEATVKRELSGEQALAEATATVAGEGLRTRSSVVVSRETVDQVIPLSEAVKATEKKALITALRHTKGNRKLAAKLLGISRGTLYNKLDQHELADRRFDD